MRLLFLRYTNVYKSNRIFYLNLNFYEKTINDSLNDLYYDAKLK